MILSAVLTWTLAVPQRTATELPRPGSAVRSLNVGGYLPGWRFPQLTSSKLDGVTDVIVFSVQPTDKGEVEIVDLSTASLAALRRIKGSSRFRTWLTLGGWSRSDGFAPTAASPQHRKRLIEEVTFFMEREGFDGVDFDWQSPKTAKELADYALLVEEAKAFLAPRKKLVSASLRSWVNTPKSMWKNLDRIHLHRDLSALLGLKVGRMRGFKIDQPAPDFAVFLGLVYQQLYQMIAPVFSVLAFLLRGNKNIIDPPGHHQHRNHKKTLV